MSLYSLFRNTDGRITSKWAHYIPIYEQHLTQYVNQSFVFFEIGIRYGGSLSIWRSFLGPHAIIVGVDIDANCKCLEDADNGIYVEIGSQNDPDFLQALVNKYGRPHVVIDDGSHRSKDINITFDYLYPLLPDNSTYIVEDLHTCYWEEYLTGIPENQTFTNRMKGFIDQININHTRGKVKNLNQLNGLIGMHVYDSMAVFEKQKNYNTQQFIVGKNSDEEFQKLNPKLRNKKMN